MRDPEQSNQGIETALHPVPTATAFIPCQAVSGNPIQIQGVSGKRSRPPCANMCFRGSAENTYVSRCVIIGAGKGPLRREPLQDCGKSIPHKR